MGWGFQIEPGHFLARAQRFGQRKPIRAAGEGEEAPGLRVHGRLNQGGPGYAAQEREPAHQHHPAFSIRAQQRLAQMALQPGQQQRVPGAGKQRQQRPACVPAG